MKNNSTINCEVLKEQASELHALTMSTHEMCGGRYEKSLSRAEVYFSLNGGGTF